MLAVGQLLIYVADAVAPPLLYICGPTHFITKVYSSKSFLYFKWVDAKRTSVYFIVLVMQLKNELYNYLETFDIFNSMQIPYFL